MNIKTEDTKLFHKLARRQWSVATNVTDKLATEDTELRCAEEACHRFMHHVKSLHHPVRNQLYTENLNINSDIKVAILDIEYNSGIENLRNLSP